MSSNPPDEHRRCDGCHTHRTCRYYMGMWFCLIGPSRCFKHRKRIHQDHLALRRRKETRT